MVTKRICVCTPTRKEELPPHGLEMNWKTEAHGELMIKKSSDVDEEIGTTSFMSNREWTYKICQERNKDSQVKRNGKWSRIKTATGVEIKPTRTATKEAELVDCMATKEPEHRKFRAAIMGEE